MYDYLTVSEIAALCRVGENTVRVWLRSGRLPGAHVGRNWRASREDVEKFLKGGDSLDRSGKRERKEVATFGGSGSSSGAAQSATGRSFSASRSLTPRVIG